MKFKTDHVDEKEFSKFLEMGMKYTGGTQYLYTWCPICKEHRLGSTDPNDGNVLCKHKLEEMTAFAETKSKESREELEAIYESGDWMGLKQKFNAMASEVDILSVQNWKARQKIGVLETEVEKLRAALKEAMMAADCAESRGEELMREVDRLRIELGFFRGEDLITKAEYFKLREETKWKPLLEAAEAVRNMYFGQTDSRQWTPAEAALNEAIAACEEGDK